MKPRTLLVLLLLVAGLGAFVWLKERTMPSSLERAERGKSLFGLETKQVTALVLEVGGRSVRMEREPELAKPEGEPNEGEPASTAFSDTARWKIVAPLAAPADGNEVERILGSLLGLEKQRTLADFDSAELGLSSPRGRVTVEAGAAAKTMAIGAQVPQSDSMVVTIEGGKEAFVVPSFVFAYLGKAPGDWRDKALVRGQRDDVESVRLIPELGPQLALARRGEEFWLESPITDRAAREAVDRLLTDLISLKATTFVDEPKAPGELGLSPPRGTFQLKLKGQAEPLLIAVGAEKHVRVGERVVTTETDLSSFLGKPLAEWRSLSWSSFDSWAVEGATVEDAQGRFELKRDKGAWLRDGVEVPYTPVGDLLAAVSEAKAEMLEEPGAAPEAKAPLTLTLVGKEGRSETLGLFEVAAGQARATVSGRPVMLKLPASTVDDLKAKIAALRVAQPAPKEE